MKSVECMEKKRVRFDWKKHPFIAVFLLWLFFFLSFACFKIDGVVPVSYLLSMAMAGGAVYSLAAKKEKIRKVPKEKQKALLYMLGAVIYAGLMMYTFEHIRSSSAIRSRNEIVPFAFLTAAVIAYCIAVSVKKKWSEKRIIFVMLIFSSIVQLFLMMVAKFNLTQSDMGYFFSDGHGHAGYIEYLYNHNFIPAQFDPREKWQYYHPPLYHILEAVFLRLQILCGVDIRVAINNTQYPNLLYMMLSVVCSYLIFKELKFRKLPLVLATAVMAFSPAFRYVALLLNNDMLSVLFIFLCILYTIRWYKKPTAKNILKIAICFGLGMFTKMSVALIAPSIAIVFLYVLIKKLKAKEYLTFKKYIGQMFAFLGVAAPIGLYWSVRNLIRWGVPLGYVPFSKEEIQYIPEPVWQRIFDFDIKQFVNPYANYLEYSDTFNEYNPLVALLKTSATEYGVIRFILGQWAGYLAFWTTFVVAVISFAFMVYVLFKKKSFSGIGKAFFLSAYVVYFISYEYFCIQYPYTCTEHIRYAMPLILAGALFIGLGIKIFSQKSSKLAKWIMYITTAAVTAFSAANTIIFITYGIKVTIEMML